MLAELAVPSHNAAIMKEPGLLISDLRAMLEATSPTSRLGQWFTANHAAFEDLLRTVRPQWEMLAAKFAEEGLIAVPPEFWHEDDTPERRLARKRAGQAARQIWQRVKRRPVNAGAPASTALAPRARRERGTTPSVAHELMQEAADEEEFRPARRR